MRNIIFITNQFKIGGVESVFINIAETISPRQIFLLPIHSNFDNEILSKLPKNVQLILLRKTNIKQNLFGLLKLYFISKKIKKIFVKEDTIIINFSDTLSTLLFSHFLKNKEVFSWVHCNPKEFTKSTFVRLYSYLLSKCYKICFICESQKNLFFRVKQFKNISNNKALVITNTVNYESIKLLSNEKNLNINSNFFLMVARIDERTKDFFTVIKAYSQLDKSIQSKYKLVFAGDGADRCKIERYIEDFRLKENVVLLGNIANPYKYMKNATIYIHSSKSEGFSLVLLEAMACGCSVLSSNCEIGPSEILDNGRYGGLFVPGNYNELKQSIENMLKTKHLMASTNNYERVNYINDLGRKQLEDFFNEYC